MKKVIEIISYWEKLKALIAESNIYADEEISIIDNYFQEELKREIYGKSKG